KQTGATFFVTQTTVLLFGTTMKAPKYTLYAGYFYGDGCDFWGTLSNGEIGNPNGGGTVHPGLRPGTPGTIPIHGAYQQASTGVLEIDFTGTPGLVWGRLNVQRDVTNSGGTAYVAGGIVFNRDASFIPGPMTDTFLSTAGGLTTGIFNWPQPGS